METKDYIKMALGGLGSLTIVTLGFIFKSIMENRYNTELPPEYWIAKKAEYEASVEKHKISEESNERLVIDLRNREETERAREREFIANAPDAYWQQQALAEREKTAREREITRRKIYEK